MTDQATSPPLPFWLQLLLGAIAGMAVCTAIAMLGAFGVPLNLVAWIIIFAIVWLGVFLCIRFHLRGVILGFGVAAFLGYVVVQGLLNSLSRL